MVQHQDAIIRIALLGLSGQRLAVGKGQRVVQDDYVKIGVFNVVMNLFFCTRCNHRIAGVAKHLTLHGKHGIALARA